MPFLMDVRRGTHQPAHQVRYIVSWWENIPGPSGANGYHSATFTTQTDAHKFASAIAALPYVTAARIFSQAEQTPRRALQRA